MPEERGFIRETQPGNSFPVLPDFEDHFYDIVNVTLGINPPWNREPDQIHLRGARKHQKTDFHAANSSFQIKLCCQRNTWKLIRRDMRQERSGIEIDGVTTRWLHDRNAMARNVIAQISRRGDAVAQVVLFQRFLHANGDGLEIAPGQAAVSGIPFRQDQQVFFLLGEQVVQRNPPILAMPSFLSDMVQPSP